MSTDHPFAVNVPINQVSFGAVSIALLREMYHRKLFPAIFPIGAQGPAEQWLPQVLSTQPPDPAFQQWLTNCINGAQQRHSRDHRALRLWHIGGSLESVSSKGNDLITFQETGQLSQLETHILHQQKKVYVTNRYAQSFFKQCGVDSIYVPLGFDPHCFNTLERRPLIPGVISFLLAGKAETKRKWTYRQLALWAKRYGNRKEYRLNCAIGNSFLSPEHQNALIGQALEGKQYNNIVFHNWCQTTAEYNTLLQSSEIVLACSGSEGFGLPEFQAAAMGAWPVALDAHAYQDHFNNDNAVMVRPSGMEPIYDNIFFQHGQLINQGNVFSFTDDAFYAACEIAEKRVKEVGLNTEGLKLQRVTYSDTFNALLPHLTS